MIQNQVLTGVVVNHTADVKIESTGTEKGDPSYRVAFKVDFTGWTVGQVLDLAVRTLVISRQRVWRKMKKDEVLAENGKTFLASDMGKQPRMTVDPVAAFKVRYANASPEEQKAMLAELMEMSK